MLLWETSSWLWGFLKNFSVVLVVLQSRSLSILLKKTYYVFPTHALLLSVVETDNICRETWGLWICWLRLLLWRRPGSEKNGRGDSKLCSKFHLTWLCDASTGQGPVILSDELWGHKEETQCPVFLKSHTHKMASAEISWSGVIPWLPSLIFQRASADGHRTQLLVGMQLLARVGLKTAWSLWRSWDFLALQPSRSKYKRPIVIQ